MDLAGTMQNSIPTWHLHSGLKSGGVALAQRKFESWTWTWVCKAFGEKSDLKVRLGVRNLTLIWRYNWNSATRQLVWVLSAPSLGESPKRPRVRLPSTPPKTPKNCQKYGWTRRGSGSLVTFSGNRPSRQPYPPSPHVSWCFSCFSPTTPPRKTHPTWSLRLTRRFSQKFHRGLGSDTNFHRGLRSTIKFHGGLGPDGRCSVVEESKGWGNRSWNFHERSLAVPRTQNLRFLHAMLLKHKKAYLLGHPPPGAGGTPKHIFPRPRALWQHGLWLGLLSLPRKREVGNLFPKPHLPFQWVTQV